MTGANRVWFMDDVTKLGEAALPAQPDTAWVMGTGAVGPGSGWTFGKLAPVSSTVGWAVTSP